MNRIACSFCSGAREFGNWDSENDPLSPEEVNALCGEHTLRVLALLEILNAYYGASKERNASRHRLQHNWACSAPSCTREGKWAVAFVFRLENGEEHIAGSTLVFCTHHKSRLELEDFVSSAGTLIYNGRLVDLFSSGPPPAGIVSARCLRWNSATLPPQRQMYNISRAFEFEPGRLVK